ncbi:MAG: single-stranded-DNA-specific exonuclease RecJ [Candidatus Omnitrophica bacterium]|nr:single-stranded-DNA-specific exonuclease RecJ [Candidatus Omnitrophota bacterium]
MLGVKGFSWKIRGLDDRIKNLSSKYNISLFLAQVFINRNIPDNNFNSFLNPSTSEFYSFSLLPDIEKGVQRIKKAIKNKEKVLVYGDYDVDGITSLAIFHEFAEQYPDIFSFYIPHRIKEGYGLNEEVLTKAKNNNISLILTFDCGTNAYKEIEIARSLNIDIIIIDHHHPKEGLTPSLAFINPKREGSIYPYPDLSAGGLSFKFLQALTGDNCYEVLDLVALSTVCDVSPLIGENRSLVKEGLKVLKNTSRAAIKALCKAGSIKQENIDIFHIGFILGPRINAAGRVSHAKESLDLFFSRDEDKAFDQAVVLNKHNLLRKKIETDILLEAEKIVEENIKNNRVIVVSGEGWHPGVLGIVASRLSKKYYMPAFVISFDKGLGVGSARSIDDIHLIKTLDKCPETLTEYGGHSKAAGIQINKNELDNFTKSINNIVEKEFADKKFIPSLDIDACLTFDDINMNLVEELEKLKPYGEGNVRPLFVTHNVFKKTALKKIKWGYSVWLINKTNVLEAVINDKKIVDFLTCSNEVDIVFSLDKNNYYNSIKLVIRDCRLSCNES